MSFNFEPSQTERIGNKLCDVKRQTAEMKEQKQHDGQSRGSLSRRTTKEGVIIKAHSRSAPRPGVSSGTFDWTKLTPEMPSHPKEDGTQYPEEKRPLSTRAERTSNGGDREFDMPLESTALDVN